MRRSRFGERPDFGTWRGGLRRRLDRYFEGLEDRLGTHPQLGWIRVIREARGITLGELGFRMGVSRQRVLQIEQSEVAGTLPYPTLERVAAALNCRVRYVFLPDIPLELMAWVRPEERPEARGRRGRAEGEAP